MSKHQATPEATQSDTESTNLDSSELPRRSFLRYSLRTMLAGVTVACAGTDAGRRLYQNYVGNAAKGHFERAKDIATYDPHSPYMHHMVVHLNAMDLELDANSISRSSIISDREVKNAFSEYIQTELEKDRKALSTTAGHVSLKYSVMRSLLIAHLCDMPIHELVSQKEFDPLLETTVQREWGVLRDRDSEMIDLFSSYYRLEHLRSICLQAGKDLSDFGITKRKITERIQEFEREGWRELAASMSSGIREEALCSRLALLNYYTESDVSTYISKEQIEEIRRKYIPHFMNGSAKYAQNSYHYHSDVLEGLCVAKKLLDLQPDPIEEAFLNSEIDKVFKESTLNIPLTLETEELNTTRVKLYDLHQAVRHGLSGR